MTTPIEIQYGVVQVVPTETFANPGRGLDHDALKDKMVEDYEKLLSDEPARPQSVSSWPRIRDAIYYRPTGQFRIVASAPDFTGELSFYPERPDSGDYEIHSRPRGGAERGRTVRVIAVAADETDTRLSMLTPFATRYAIVTVGNERPHQRKMWLVGLKDFRTVDETDNAEDAADLVKGGH